MSCVPCVRAGEAKLRGSASAVMIPPKLGVGGRKCILARGAWRGRCSAGARPVPGARVPGARDDPSEARGRRAKVWPRAWRRGGVARPGPGRCPVPGARVPGCPVPGARVPGCPIAQDPDIPKAP